MKDDLLSRSLTRRQVVLGSVVSAGALTFLPVSSLVTAAQDSSDFASLGYPELKVTITENGYEGIPDTLPAGRYLLTATVTGGVPAELSNDQTPPTVAFVSPTPAGLSADDFLQIIGGAASPAGATPEMGATPSASDQQGDEDQQLPLAVYQMKFAGGTMVFPGQTATQAVIDLTAGEWIAWADDPGGPATTIFTVTGDFPAEVKDPEADITATLIDFAITIEGDLTAGKHTIKVQHHGAQPHFLEVEKGPDTMTRDQVAASIAGEMSGTPAANGISDSELQPVFYSPTQSIGTVTWHEIDLPAGMMVAACFFPTAGTGVPHAAEGMFDVFQVTS